MQTFGLSLQMTLGLSDVQGLMERERWCQVAGEAGGYQCVSPNFHAATPMPGITETPTVTCCEMCRCQHLLCSAKEWNWKLLSFFSEKIRELFSYSEWTPEAPGYSIHLSRGRNQWFLCSLIHWLGYQVKDFTPFQEKDLKITFHSAGEEPGHQILSWTIRARETERGMLPLCLLAQQFHILSWVKFSKTNTFAQKASVLINCHFPTTQNPNSLKTC